MGDWKNIFLTRKDKRESEQLMREFQKSEDYRNSQRMTKEQFSILKHYFPDVYGIMTKKSFSSRTLENSDIAMLTQLSREENFPYLSYFLLFNPLKNINPDTLSDEQYEKVFAIVLIPLTKDDSKIDPYGNAKESALQTLGLWFSNRRLKRKDKRFRTLIEPLTRDPRPLVALNAKGIMRRLP
jgi:hypothetical protein